MPQLLFYQQPEMLNRYRHRHLRLQAVPEPYGFARRTNSTILTLAEFAPASRVYPILFAQDGAGKPVPVALLGLRNDENLFVDDAGEWDAPYIPAFVRRYPFVLAQEGEQLTVCIDRAYAGFIEAADGAATDAPAGTPLFDAEGEPNAPLRESIQFLEAYQRAFEAATAFCAELAEHALLTEVHAVANLSDTRRFSLSGLWAIDEARLATLPADVLQRWTANGTMKAVMAHRLSLELLPSLAARLEARAVTQTAAAAPVQETTTDEHAA